MIPVKHSFALLLALALGSSARAETVRIRGSGLAFDRLGSLRDSLARSLPDLELDWAGYGSQTAVPALVEGAADLVLLSRELSEMERELLARFAIETVEHVLALDALAVVAHPSNPVQDLALSQLRSIFGGAVVGWHGVGGPDLPIRLVLPHRSSGDASFLERRLLSSSGGITRTADWVEPSAIIPTVAADRRALAVVSMSVDRTAVKTIPIRSDDGGDGVLPTVETVDRGDYPLDRPLFVYRRSALSEPVRRVLSFLLLIPGQTEIARAGFVSLPADRPIVRTYSSASTGTSATVAVARVGFAFRSSRVNGQAQRTLDGVVEAVLRSGGDVWVTGHSEPDEEPPGESGLSSERAQIVAEYLRARGVDVSRAAGRGADEPVYSPETPDGRRGNRRADLWILPRR